MARVKAILHRFEQLSLRERSMVFLALAFVLFQMGELIIGSARHDLKAVQSQLASERQTLAQLTQQANETTDKLTDDPNKKLLGLTEQLRLAVKNTQTRLKQLSDELITPSRMAELLQQILARQEGLQLISLRTLKTRPLNTAKDGPKLPIFAHDFALEFQGSYMDTLRYLEQLEQLSGGIYWDAFELHTEKYPRNRIRLELHTLSLSEDWIGA